MFAKTIKSRVMKAVNQKIDEVEKLYASDKKALEQRHKKEQDELIETHVNGLLSKIL